MPFLCDVLAFSSLILVVWWTRKLGSASFTGLIFAILSFILRPGAFFIVAFVVASVTFDLLTRAVGYGRLFGKPTFGSLYAIATSTVCAALAGAIIGTLFMNFTIPTAIAAFAGLHAIGGFIGGIIGAGIITALNARRIEPRAVRG